MDRDEMRNLLGEAVLDRAERYESRVEKLECETDGSGTRHLTARVRGNTRRFYLVQAWLRAGGRLVNAECSCPYNQYGEGPYCKHIGAVLLRDARQEAKRAPTPPDRIPGVMRGVVAFGRKNDYAANVELLFGQKWHEPEPESDYEMQQLLERYQKDALESPEQDGAAPGVPEGAVRLLPEFELEAGVPWLRLHITDGGRSYVVKSVPALLAAVEEERLASYGKALSFVHRREAFDTLSRQLLAVLRRQQSVFDEMGVSAAAPQLSATRAPSGSVLVTAGLFDDLFALYEEEVEVLGQYELRVGLPEELILHVEKQRGGVRLSLTPEVHCYQGLDYDYLYNEEWICRVGRGTGAQVMPALRTLSRGSTFLTQADTARFCSYVLPELGAKITLDDPGRLLLNQIPLEPVTQFYLDVPASLTVTAHAEFVYGEDRVTPSAAPKDLRRDMRAEARAQRLLQRWLEPGWQGQRAMFSVAGEDEVAAFLEDGVPALMAAGEVYLSDAFRNLQAVPPRISVGVSVHGSVLDLEVDTGEFPAEELRALLQSLRRKKRYHRLRDGRLLRLDESMEALDELNETLELSGAQLGETHLQLPLYRAPSLDRALSGQNGVQFNRDDAFRRISRSFHAVQDSEYTPPPSLQKTLRKYQRDGYRWLRTLDGYGMGGILADDMGLGKTLQVLSYLLARKEAGQPGPSLIVCPASLVLNWEEECRRFTPALRCLAVDGSAGRRAALAAQWAEADLVVTSYDLLRRDVALYAKQPFYACILDEAQAIKNHTTQKYKAVCRVHSQVRFALTGTPVENRLGELWSIFSFLMPGYLPPYKSFFNRFEKPIAVEKDANAARRLNQLTGPFILRRMKFEVLRELPPKTESVYRIELEPQQRKLYLAAVLETKEKLATARPEDKVAVFAALMRLREICCDPRLVAEDWEGGSAKLDACMELAASAVEGGHRILLFSQFTSMLALLAERLDAAGITHFTLQGSTPKPERAELVRRFNAGEAPVFLISLRAGGTGLNLTAADIVIHYDPWWNLAAQNQATDRAYRIGQRNPVQVYQLVAQDTIEEKILELQQAKQALANTVTGGADGGVLSMKPEELLALLDSVEE